MTVSNGLQIAALTDVGMRRTGCHVARVLLVSGGVDNDETPGFGVEILPRDVDRDALLALGDEAVEQHREIWKIRAGSLAA